MKDLRFFGKTFVAVAMIVFGLQHFVYLDFVTRAYAPLPNWIPAQALFAIFFGSLLCATGIAIIANIKAHTMSLLLAGTILLMFALCLLPDLLTNLNNPMLWTNSGKALVLTGSNLIVAGSISTKSSKGPIKYLEFLIPLGKLFLAGFFALAATMHFLYADFVATLIPAWIPGHLFWTYFAAVALLAGALDGWARGQHRVGIGETNHRIDLILLDKLLGYLRGDIHFILGVVDNQVDRAPAHAAAGVDLLDRQFGAIGSRQIELRLIAGERKAAADLDRATRGSRRGSRPRRAGFGRGI